MIRAKRAHPKRRWMQWGLALLAISLMLFLSACGSLTPKGQSAQQEQARLNTEIQQAAKLGVPNSLLTPIRQQEAKAANKLQPPGIFGDPNSDSAYEQAIASYQQLESQLTAVTQQAISDASYQANLDIQTFESLVQQLQSQGFTDEVSGYQSRLKQIENAFNAGVTPNDFDKVDADAKQQVKALQLLDPTYQMLQTLQGSIKQMQKAKLNTALGQEEYQADLTTFRAASMPADYQKLSDTISAQIDQLAADQVAAIPFIGAAMIATFQQQITQAQTYGVNVTTYQQQLAQDQQDLNDAHTLQGYLALSSRIQSQLNNMQGVLIKGKTNYDLQQLKTLIGTTNINNDYEYRDAQDGYSDQMYNYSQAQSLDDYQAVDNQVQILLTNLKASIANLSDKTAHDQPHATDLQLMQDYNLTGQVVIVSLTEQTMRVYDNGQLVRTIYVVTGQVAAPSPAGLWNVFYMGTHLVFKSDDPPGSALWYPPTPINYGMEYHSDGYFLHDATWRSYFGPGANFAHPDYTSGQYSDNGSHGCVNMDLSNASWLYGWVTVGTPVILY